MKFTTQSKTLKEVLSKVTNVIYEKTTLPILANAYFFLKGNTLTVIGTNLETYVLVSIIVKGLQDGESVIPAKFLNNILSSYDTDITIEQFKNNVVLTAGDSSFKIATEDAEDFPKNVELEKMTAVPLTGENITSIFKCLHSASTDELRRTMNGVYVEFSDKNFVFAATDGHRLSRVKGDLTSEYKKGSLLIPLTPIEILKKYVEKETVVSTEKTEEFIKFTVENMVIISRLIDDTFPKYESVIPDKLEDKITADRKELLLILRRIAPMFEDVTMTVKNNVMTITAKNDAIESKDTIKLKSSTVKEADLKFNLKYLIQLLTEFSNDITFNIKQKAMIMVTENSYLELLMQKRNIDEVRPTKTADTPTDSKTAPAPQTEEKKEVPAPNTPKGKQETPKDKPQDSKVKPNTKKGEKPKAKKAA